MYILSVEQMRRAEAAADAAGETYASMMERAGQAVAAAVRRLRPTAQLRVLILVGPGNNGGDGLVAAYHLRQAGAEVCCYIWKRKAAGESLAERAAQAGCRLLRAEEDAGGGALAREAEVADVIVDALLGTGADRPIAGALKDILSAVRCAVEVRRSPRPAGEDSPRLLDPIESRLERPLAPLVLAVDVPSGLNCDSGVPDPSTLPADVTVTFGFPKRGQIIFPGADLVGRLLVADIGIAPHMVENPRLHLVTGDMVAERLPARPRYAHKGTFGRALIVAGSVNYIGAPALAAAAATRVGAGLVTLALAEDIHAAVSAKLMEPTYILLPSEMGVISSEAIRVLDERLDGYEALLIGPGLSQEKEVVRFVQEFLAGKGRDRPRSRGRIGFGAGEEDSEPAPALPPLVIDADALNALARSERWWERVPAGSILTPHPGEMARLLGTEIANVQADRLGVASRAAGEWNQIVVLKGAHTVIAEPAGDVYVLPFANPILASAGTGDVLAGAIVGLLAQGLKPLDAALAGAFLHGLAGEEVERSRRQGAGTVASDLLPVLPVVQRRLWG